MEAALRIREDGVDCTITAISVGNDSARDVLKVCVGMGADASILVTDDQADAADGFRVARILAAAIRELDDVGLVLCGRQGSDYDQGLVPAVLAEELGAAFVAMAADVRLKDGVLRVKRVTPRVIETVECATPAVVSVSNELGQARFPTSRGLLAARKNPPTMRAAADLAVNGNGHRIELENLLVPDVQGHCEMISGGSPAELVTALLARLRAEGVL